jgi:methionine synthase I (cobalamin-dependent)
MTTWKVTFSWVEDDAMSYDELMDNLIHLGADGILTEEVEDEEEEQAIMHRPKKKR